MSIRSQTINSKRSRKLTDKGKVYQLELIENRVAGILKLIRKRIPLIESHIQSENVESEIVDKNVHELAE